MKIIKEPEIFQKEMRKLSRSGKTIGFVPTMGALHEGHLSLVRAARRENDIVAASIFVNPLQFGPKEDFKKYPRPFEKDRLLLEKEKTDYLFYPSAAAMYGKNFSTIVETGIPFPGYSLNSLTNVLCGKSRPGHFRGVTTVVAKLFHLAHPDRVYLGAKDYQQCAVVRQMMTDLNMDIEMRRMPTFREKDGLAMSSRNQYLSGEDRRRAAMISYVLFWVEKQIKAGEHDLGRLKKEAIKKLKGSVDKIDYFEIVDPETLLSLKKFQPEMTVLAACFVGKTRLIDNVIIQNH